jgi:hypothetical protein
MREAIRRSVAALLVAMFMAGTLIARTADDTCEGGYNERLAQAQADYNECMTWTFGNYVYMSLCYADYERARQHATAAFYTCRGWFWLTSPGGD